MKRPRGPKRRRSWKPLQADRQEADLATGTMEIMEKERTKAGKTSEALEEGGMRRILKEEKATERKTIKEDGRTNQSHKKGDGIS